MGEIRIYTDESVDIAVTRGLRRRGIEAFSARDTENLGLTDEQQLLFACGRKAVIFTHDADFLRLAAKWIERKKTHHGVIYCHQTDRTIGESIRRLRLLATILTAEDMIDHIEFL